MAWRQRWQGFRKEVQLRRRSGPNWLLVDPKDLPPSGPYRHPDPLGVREVGVALAHYAWLRRRGEDDEARARRLRRWPARLSATVLLIFGVILAFNIGPQHIKVSSHPSIIDQTFQSRALVLAIRLVVVFAAAYVSLSLFANMWDSRWLSKAGPFEVSESVVIDLKEDVRTNEKKVLAGAEEIAKLRERLQRSDSMIKDLTQIIEARVQGQTEEGQKSS